MASGAIVPKEELAVVRREGRAVVLDLDRLEEPPLVLTGTAAEIWALLDGREVDDVIREMAALHELEPEVIAADVQAFLDDLLGREILRVVGAER